MRVAVGMALFLVGVILLVVRDRRDPLWFRLAATALFWNVAVVILAGHHAGVLKATGAVAGALLLVFLGASIFQGRVSPRGAAVYRRTSPVLFWFNVLIIGAIAAILLFVSLGGR